MVYPSIPDNTYKFLLYIGLIVIGYCFIQYSNTTDNYNKLVEVSNAYLDSLTIKIMYHEQDKKGLLESADDLSKKYNIRNPTSSNDTSMYFTKTLRGTKEEIIVSDTLQNIWRSYKLGEFEIKVLDKKSDMMKTNLKNAERDYNYENYSYIVLAILGFIVCLIGYFGMERNQTQQDKLIMLEINQKESKYKCCQSCGKTFSSVIIHGHNTNGEINPAFCIDCYDNGKFKEPNLTIEEFNDRAKQIIESRKYAKHRAYLEKKFKNLERWKTDFYI